MKRAITITGWKRPHLFRTLLETLAANDLRGWTTFIQLEPSEFVADFRAAAEQLLPPDSFALTVNTRQLGIRANPHALLDRAFGTGADLILYLEEDLRIATDVTALASWYADHHQPEWMCLSLLSGGCGSAGLISYPDFPAILFAGKCFNSLGFALRRQEWLHHVEPAWFEDFAAFRRDSGEPAIGWDWSVYYHLLNTPGLVSLQPAAARATHNGRLGGVNCRPEFHDLAFTGLELVDAAAAAADYIVVPPERLPVPLNRHVALWEEKNRALQTLRERVAAELARTAGRREFRGAIARLRKLVARARGRSASGSTSRRHRNASDATD